MSVRLPILPLAAITTPEQMMRCHPYGASISAGACLRRQRAIGTRGGRLNAMKSGYRHDFALCVGCADGAQVRAQVGES